MKHSGANWTTGLRMLGAGLLSLSLISCSASGSKVNTAVPTISLPDPPAYLRPVGVAQPQLGDDPLLVAARERAGRLQCNARINTAVADWKAMQAFYSSPVQNSR
jgi:hypothetical protein